MKKSWKTPEFWAALIGQGVALAVLVGGLTEAQGAEMEAALKSISGGVLSILTILGYIKAQSNRRLAAVRLMACRVALAGYDLDPVANPLVKMQIEDATEDAKTLYEQL